MRLREHTWVSSQSGPAPTAGVRRENAGKSSPQTWNRLRFWVRWFWNESYKERVARENFATLPFGRMYVLIELRARVFSQSRMKLWFFNSKKATTSSSVRTRIPHPFSCSAFGFFEILGVLYLQLVLHVESFVVWAWFANTIRVCSRASSSSHAITYVIRQYFEMCTSVNLLWGLHWEYCFWQFCYIVEWNRISSCRVRFTHHNQNQIVLHTVAFIFLVGASMAVFCFGPGQSHCTVIRRMPSGWARSSTRIKCSFMISSVYRMIQISISKLVVFLFCSCYWLFKRVCSRSARSKLVRFFGFLLIVYPHLIILAECWQIIRNEHFLCLP